MHWYLDVLRKYAVFSGRARRSEYWFFALINALIMVALYVVAAMIARPNADPATAMTNPAFIVYFLYVLAVLLPSIAVGVRRLHDIGKSGWWMFITFVPLIGGIWLIVLDCQDSQPGENQYGPNPKGESSIAVASAT